MVTSVRGRLYRQWRGADVRLQDAGHQFGKTQRLGNENDFYIETGPILDHMLGDDPDVMDVRVKMTFQFSTASTREPLLTSATMAGVRELLSAIWR